MTDPKAMENRKRKKKDLSEVIGKFGFDPGLFSDNYLIEEPKEGAGLEAVARRTGIPKDRINQVLLIPTALDEVETSWYSLLRQAIKLETEGKKDLRGVLNLFKISEVGAKEGKLKSARLFLKGYQKKLTLYLPHWLSEDQKIDTLTAIGMIPELVLGEQKEMIVVYPFAGDYRFLSLSQRRDRADELYLAESNREELSSSWTPVFIVDFLKP